MTRYVRHLAALFVATLIATSVAYLSSQIPTRAQSDKIVRISTAFVAIDYAPYMIARKNGWLEQELATRGYRVQHLDPFQSVPAINEAVAANQVDAVLAAEIPAIIGRAAGVDVRLAWLSATLNAEIMVPANSSVASVPDLKGKTVALLAGSGSHYGLVTKLAQHGMNRNDIQILDMPPPVAKAAFETNQVDAWATWPPFVEQEIVAGKGKILSDSGSQIQVVMLVRGSWAAQNPGAIEGLAKALNRAKEWIIENPKMAQAIVSDDLRVPASVVELAWPKIDWRTQFTTSVISDIQSKANFLQELGFIRNRVDVQQELMLPQSLVR